MTTEHERVRKRIKDRRRKLRRLLESKDVPQATIERKVQEFNERMERRLEAARWRDEQAAADVPDVDDAGHRPTRVDPVLTGTARATGTAAAAVRRGRTFTKTEHEARTDRGDR